MCSVLPFKEILETAISVVWYSTNIKMPNIFSLAQTVILQSGISVSGLAVREREREHKSEVSSQSAQEREADEKKSK